MVTVLVCGMGYCLVIDSEGVNTMTPEQRYQRDPQFHRLVRMLENLIHNAEFTPTELREALILAQTNFELCRGVPTLFIDKEKNQ